MEWMWCLCVSEAFFVPRIESSRVIDVDNDANDNEPDVHPTNDDDDDDNVPCIVCVCIFL